MLPNENWRYGFIYSRVSTVMQVDTGYSLEYQDVSLSEYCQKNSIVVVEKFADKGISGGSMNRPQLLKMLLSLKSGYVIVCSSVCRLSRSVDDLLKIYNLIKEKGAEIMIMDIELDTRTPLGKILLLTMGRLSQIENEKSGERISNVMQYLSKTNKLKTKPYYGWQYTDQGLVEVNEEQEVIKCIKTTLDNDPSCSLWKITKILETKGYKNRSGKKFHTSTIKSIIKHNNMNYNFINNEL